jgi:hypothetical protein
MVDTPEGISQPTKPRRLRMSLLGLLTVVALTALSITVWLQWRELKPLRAENKKLNEERGTIVVEDRSKLHAIKIPDRFAGEGRTSFRIYVPEGKLYWVFAIVNGIPKDGYPELKRFPDKSGILGSGADLPLFGRLDPGEHIVSVETVRRGAKGSDIRLIVDHLDASANTNDDVWPSATPDSYSVFCDEAPSWSVTTDELGKLVLLRRRIQAVADSSLHNSFATMEPDAPLDGVMLWIEPDRN